MAADRAALPRQNDAEREIVDWVSSCCDSSKMTTAGGDGSPGSTCWTVCGACGEPCDPVPVYFCPACTLGVNGCICEFEAVAPDA